MTYTNFFLKIVLSAAFFWLLSDFGSTKPVAEELPPAAPGTPQPQILGSGQATPTILQSDGQYLHLLDVANLATIDRKTKNIRLWNDESTLLSISGYARVETEFFENENLGRAAGENTFTDLTARIYADLTVGDRIRFFGALQAGERLSSNQRVPPVAKDAIDLHQAFVEMRLGDLLGANKNDAFVRIGRQELHYGDGRMVSARKGPNLADDVDGILLQWRFESAVIDAFAVFDVTEKPSAFNNTTTDEEGLWGLYTSAPLSTNLSADLYYLGDRNRDASFVSGVFSETRHSIGARLKFLVAPWSGDIETSHQFGRSRNQQGPLDISAWAAAGSLKFTPPQASMAANILFRAGITSGDKSETDTRMGTFRAPNPPGRYFGDTTPFGPGNLAGLSGTLNLSITDNVSISPTIRAFWRLSEDEGIYSPPGNLVRGANGNSSYLGMESALDIKYRLGQKSVVTIGAGYFEAGDYFSDNQPSENATRIVMGLSSSF